MLFDEIPAPMIYTQSGQTGAVVPFGLAGRSSVQVHVEFGAALSNSIALATAPATPGLFTLNASGTGGGAVLNQNASVNLPTNPATRGAVVQIFATGLGPPLTGAVDGSIATRTSDLVTSPTVSIGNIASTVVYAGPAPGLILGPYQVNAIVPANAPVGSSVPVVISSAGRSSQLTATIAVQ